MAAPIIQQCRQLLVLVVVLPFALLGRPVDAQMTGKLAGNPIGVGYAKNITEVTVLEYVKKLTSRINYETVIFESAPADDALEALAPKVEEQISGQAWYMVEGILPSFDSISFRKVADVADARRVLKARGSAQGGSSMSAELKDEGNDCFRFIRSWTNEFEAPGGKGKGQEWIDQQNQSMASQPNNRLKYELVEKDGKEMVKQTSSWEEQYRFYDGMLFSGRREELFEMELPSASSLTRGVQGGKDLGIDVYFDRIPSGIKTLAWNMLNATAGTMMQQRDDEETSQADVRKTSMQFGLDTVKALMFDVQEAHGWLRFANEQEQSIRGQLLFETRRNAELQKQLETASSGVSRFAPVLQDDAVATIHTCINLPEASAMFQAIATWLPGFIEQEVSSDVTAVQAAQKLAVTISELADTPTIEACVKAGWSEASDGVFYGGLRVGNNEGLIQAIVTLLQSTSPPDGIMELTEIDGRAVLHLTIPKSDQETLSGTSGLNLSDIYITQAASCIWFAVGSENAFEMIKTCVARCEAGGSAGRAPLLTAEVDGEAWLALPQDDPVGVTSLLMYLDRNVGQFPPSPTMISFGSNEKPTPLLQRCIDLGGDHKASLRVIADRSGVKIDAQIGEVIANYMLMRQIDQQEGMMRRNRERTLKVQEAAEASDKN